MSILQEIAGRLMQGMFANHPAMQQFNQMMQGKNPQQQMQTLLNFAQSNVIDPNAKIFTAEDLKALGVNIPRQG